MLDILVSIINDIVLAILMPFIFVCLLANECFMQLYMDRFTLYWIYCRLQYIPVTNARSIDQLYFLTM